MGQHETLPTCGGVLVVVAGVDVLVCCCAGERAKRALSASTTATIEVDSLYEGIDFNR